MGEQAGITARQVRRQARRAARTTRPGLVGCGRAGYAAAGVVHVLIGALAGQVALGRGGATADSRGALVRIAQLPFGRALLLAVALGIVGHALWRFLQAALDTDNAGTDAKGIAKRLGYAASGAVHVALALGALRLLRTGSAGATGDNAAQDGTAQLMGQPFGPWLVALAGLVALGLGVHQASIGVTGTFRAGIDLGAMGADGARWFTWLGRLGYTGRGAAFALIGLFLVVAARRADPAEAHGLDGALATLARQPFGPWLLGSVALGFVAYGLCLCAEARYRRMVIP